jgi:hypothetical protein
MAGDPAQHEQAPPPAAVLTALGDAGARKILKTLSTPKTANELSEECDIPLSTTYRKLELLTDAELLDELTEIRRDGSHTTRYVVGFDSVTVSHDPDESLAISMTQATRSTDERLADIWSKVQNET